MQIINCVDPFVNGSDIVCTVQIIQVLLCKARGKWIGVWGEKCTHKARVQTSSYAAICHKINCDANTAGAERLK